MLISVEFRSHKKSLQYFISPYLTVADLRHTYATAALSNGDDIKTVQTNLGHATASFTLDVYAHSSEKMKQESADRMQKFIMQVNKRA